jgi:hypothetical protein
MGPELTGAIVAALGPEATAALAQRMGTGLTVELVQAFGPQLTGRLIGAFGAQLTSVGGAAACSAPALRPGEGLACCQGRAGWLELATR